MDYLEEELLKLKEENNKLKIDNEKSAKDLTRMKNCLGLN
jgi:hypothetical protein